MKCRMIAALLIVTLLGAVTLTPALAGQASAAPSVSNTLTGTGSVAGTVLPASSPLLPFGGTLNSITITGFQVIDGVLSAVGTANITPNTASGGTGTPFNTPFSAPVSPSSATCPILQLDVGAIHLDVLGLVVNTAPIHLNISAEAGPGKLLGNLLCAVAHLLDNNGVGPLGLLATLLNQLLPAGGLTL